ncbi:MAG: J domain-containing protein [Deltaproteobacteria bacterium]|nr:J domain-containing protein [Deltaproteobacteria bacterium]
MSLGKRLLDLARANLTDFRHALSRDDERELLDAEHEERARARAAEEERAASEAAEGEDAETIGARAGRGARRFKDAAEEAWERAFEAARARAGVRGGPPSDPAGDRRRWYRTLELEPGADLKEVRRAYRRLMKQYHPDRFANDPEKLKVATEVTRKLNEAYNGLVQLLGG